MGKIKRPAAGVQSCRWSLRKAAALAGRATMYIPGQAYITEWGLAEARRNYKSWRAQSKISPVSLFLFFIKKHPEKPRPSPRLPTVPCCQRHSKEDTPQIEIILDRKSCTLLLRGCEMPKDGRHANGDHY